MTHDRNTLPQLDEALFLTESGLETTLVFHDGIDLPHFSATIMMRDNARRAILRHYYARHLKIAKDAGMGFVIDSPTWRASPDWAEPIGYTLEELAAENRHAIRLLSEVRDAHSDQVVVLNAVIGPRGDGYDPGNIGTADEFEAYHSWQVDIFAGTEVDMASAITITNTPEAIGIVRAAKTHDLPVVVSFTVETDGCLPTGEPLAEAIRAVDEATGNGPAYYMVNCAHPTHFSGALEDGASWMDRIRGIRANASRCSHAELDEATELDDGDPQELGRQYAALRSRFPGITVLGGCCGTDHRHIAAIVDACAPASRKAA